MSLYLKKAFILILLPHAHSWHMMSGINVVKASNFCFISDNKFLKVPEKPQDHIDRGGTGREQTCSYDSSEEQLQVGLQVVTFTNGFAAARKAV